MPAHDLSGDLQGAPKAPGPAHTAAVAEALALAPARVAAALRLFASGCTVPFVARYRKEATQNLDEHQLRQIAEQQGQLTERDARRATVLDSLTRQGVLTPALMQKIMAAKTRAEIDDIYLPFRPKRRTRATVAQERGLAPLADAILAQGDARALAAAELLAAARVAETPDLTDVAAAWAGAQDIVAEQLCERAELRKLVRTRLLERGILRAQVPADKAKTPSKFELYYDYEAPIAGLPGHRFLAMRRGEREGFLRLRLRLEPAEVVWLGEHLATAMGKVAGSAFAQRLDAAVQDALQRLLLPSVETDVRLALKAAADAEAVEVFGGNLRNLLLAAPLGTQAVVGLDPGLRTGCKLAAVSATGAFLGSTTLYLHQGQAQRVQAGQDLLAFLRRHPSAYLAVGNGTGGREAWAFVRETLAAAGAVPGGAPISVVMVNEAGASVYSASDLARTEHPELDVTVRGAISIARRLQDPLAELVKIDPKAIGVGQYQHDVHQPLLSRKLDEVVESSVHHVGVNLNTASAALLGRIAGLGPALAARIVAAREAKGPFKNRRALLDVEGLGPRAFEQAAGFLRVLGGEQPLDASGVHPERYPLVATMAADLGVAVEHLVGNAKLSAAIALDRYITQEVGAPTLRDILQELARPGLDPRDDFRAARFDDGVQALEDLRPDMVLEGVVTNVTAFGAFVDVGVHQDGLVHISELSDRFVADPHAVVQVGQLLQVRILEVDLVRRRVALSARRPKPGHAQGQPARREAVRSAPGHAGRAHNAPPRAVRAGAPLPFGHNPFAKLRPI